MTADKWAHEGPSDAKPSRKRRRSSAIPASDLRPVERSAPRHVENGMCHICKINHAFVVNCCARNYATHAFCDKHLQKICGVSRADVLRDPSLFQECPACSLRCPCAACGRRRESGRELQQGKGKRVRSRATSPPLPEAAKSAQGACTSQRAGPARGPSAAAAEDAALERELALLGLAKECAEFRSVLEGYKDARALAIQQQRREKARKRAKEKAKQRAKQERLRQRASDLGVELR